MKTSGESSHTIARNIFCWLAVVCLFALPLFAQSTAPLRPRQAMRRELDLPAGIRAITILDGQWRFHTGDDPRWADPAFNDSDWPMVNLSQSLAEQGIDSYTGFGVVSAEDSAAADCADQQPRFGPAALVAGIEQFRRTT